MIDRDTMLRVVQDVQSAKAEKNIVPTSATMEEILARVRDESLETLRELYKEDRVQCHKTLNSVSFNIVKR